MCFFQAEDGIRDYKVTGVQTCALPIWSRPPSAPFSKFLCALAASPSKDFRNAALAGFGDLAGLQAARADVDAAGSPTVVDADALQVRIEASPRRHHRVAAIVPECRALGTHVTNL